MKKIKCFVATILSLGLILASSLTAAAAELPRQSTAEAVIRTQSDTDVFFVLGNGVRLRAQPGESSSVVGLLYESRNDWVEINFNNIVVDHMNWYEVVDSSIGFGGWIAGKHVNIAYPYPK